MLKIKNKPLISIVIPAWNEEKTIRNTLLSLSLQDTKVPFEVIVVDNNCTDKTVEIIKQFNTKLYTLSIVRETKQSIGAARETGFDAARANIIASTDADTILPTNWVSRIWNEFSYNKNLAGLVGTYTFVSKGPLFNGIFLQLLKGVDYTHKAMSGFFAFRGLNFAIGKSFWKKSGGFNRKISVLEDVELSLRVSKLGAITYIPSLRVETSYRRFERRFVKQLVKRLQAYLFHIILHNSNKHIEWESIRS